MMRMEEKIRPKLNYLEHLIAVINKDKETFEKIKDDLLFERDKYFYETILEEIKEILGFISLRIDKLLESQNLDNDEDKNCYSHNNKLLNILKKFFKIKKDNR